MGCVTTEPTPFAPVPIVPQPDQGRESRKRIVAAVVISVTVLLVLGGVLAALMLRAATPTAALDMGVSQSPADSSRFDVDGVVHLVDERASQGWLLGLPCSGGNLAYHFADGTTVTIGAHEGTRSRDIAWGKLAESRAVHNYEGVLVCEFRFRISGVRAGYERYNINIGYAALGDMTEAMLRSGLPLTISAPS